MTESVNNPSHYGGADNPYEAIKVIEAWGLGFNTGNVAKYLCRAGKKDGTPSEKDLQKACWYLLRELATVEGHDPAAYAAVLRNVADAIAAAAKASKSSCDLGVHDWPENPTTSSKCRVCGRIPLHIDTAIACTDCGLVLGEDGQNVRLMTRQNLYLGPVHVGCPAVLSVKDMQADGQSPCRGVHDWPDEPTTSSECSVCKQTPGNVHTVIACGECGLPVDDEHGGRLRFLGDRFLGAFHSNCPEASAEPAEDAQAGRCPSGKRCCKSKAEPAGLAHDVVEGLIRAEVDLAFVEAYQLALKLLTDGYGKSAFLRSISDARERLLHARRASAAVALVGPRALSPSDQVAPESTEAQAADPDDMEALAAIEHESWSGWHKWERRQISQAIANLPLRISERNELNKTVMSFPCMERWARQARTLYADLSEKEKESDRIEARKKLVVYRPTQEEGRGEPCKPGGCKKVAEVKLGAGEVVGVRCGRCLEPVGPEEFLHDCAGQLLESDHYVRRLEHEVGRLAEGMIDLKVEPVGHEVAVDAALRVIRQKDQGVHLWRELNEAVVSLWRELSGSSATMAPLPALADIRKRLPVCPASGMTPHQARVKAMMDGYGQEVPGTPTISDEDTRILRARLILEEALETIKDGLGVTVNLNWEDGRASCVHHLFFESLSYKADLKPDLVELADGCADLSAVTVGTLLAHGIADRELLEEVDANNMAKIATGSVDEHGKWIKSPDHQPPDVRGVILRQMV